MDMAKPPQTPKRKKVRKPRIDESLPRHGNRSIIVGVSLLKVIAGLKKPSSLGEIAQAAGMSPTRTHRYLLGLARTELVDQNPLTGRYDLGAQVVELGVAALGRVDAIRFATEALAALTERTRIASLICVWGTNGPTVVRWEQADLTSAVRIREGRNLSLLRSSSGRIFLTYLPPETVEPFLARELEASGRRAANGAGMSRARVEAIRAEVRDQGFAAAIGEEVATFAAVAAPAFDATGKLALCVTLIGTVDGIDTSAEGLPVKALKETVAQLSRRLGAPTAG